MQKKKKYRAGSTSTTGLTSLIVHHLLLIITQFTSQLWLLYGKNLRIIDVYLEIPERLLY
jgi:hypothetical protein